MNFNSLILYFFNFLILNPPSPFLYQCFHILGQRRREVHLLVGSGMHKTEGPGVQSLTRTELEGIVHILLVIGSPLATQNLRAAISLVAEQRMTDVLHVGTDLMCPSGFEDTFHEGDISETLEHPIVGDGTLADVAAHGEDCHAKPVLRVAADIAFDDAAVLHKVSPHEGIILAVGGLVEELRTE